jgi:hypothetical protein
MNRALELLHLCQYKLRLSQTGEAAHKTELSSFKVLIKVIYNLNMDVLI